MRNRPESWTAMHDSFVMPPDTRWEIHEAESQDAVNGIDLLAKVRGPFFLVDAASRNDFYDARGINKYHCRVI